VTPAALLPADPDYAADALLKDGGSIHVRAIRPDDRARLVEHFQRLSAQSVYYRFFGAKRRLTEAELDAFTRLDFLNRVGLVATLFEHGEERIIGVGRYAVVDPAEGMAEVAFAVADAHQGRGVGTLLLDHMAIARAQGLGVFTADVLGENNKMLDMFASSGFVAKRSCEGGVVHVTFPTDETEAARAATLSREMHAAAESVRTVLAPRSVAVVGASRRPGSIGAALVANLKQAGFTGPVYAVNPTATDINGLRVQPSIAAIGAPVDLAVIAVPAPAVEAAVRECAAAGVRAVVVISAGLGGRPRGAGADHALRPRRRHADGRPELHGGPQHGSGRVVERDLRAALAAGRQRRDAVAERRARARRARLREAAEHRDVDVRLGRQQGRRVRQRPLELLGRRSAHRGRGAVPRELREPAEVRAHRAGGRAA
jgi:predicted CoA-binding protein/GNAT superfamily N-acetyltransferase